MQYPEFPKIDKKKSTVDQTEKNYECKLIFTDCRTFPGTFSILLYLKKIALHLRLVCSL